MTDQPSTADDLRRQVAELGEHVATVRGNVVRHPDRREGYRIAEEAREVLEAGARDFTHAKGEILELAAEEEGRDLVGLAEIASKPGEKPVTKQRIHTLIKQSREARAAGQREGTA